MAEEAHGEAAEARMGRAGGFARCRHHYHADGSPDRARAETIADEPPRRADFLHSVLCRVGLPRRRVDGETSPQTGGESCEGNWGMLRADATGKTSFAVVIPGKPASILIVDSSNSLPSSWLAGIPRDESEGNGQQ